MRKRRLLTLVTLATMAMGSGVAQAGSKCTADSVKVGPFCMDTYEATVFRIPDPLGANKGLVKKVQKGKATAADLAAGGATLLGVGGDNYAPCTDDGQNCVNDIYAASITGLLPSSLITWFQAQQACSNSGKRLPSNAEWQQAVAGTPDGLPCNVSLGLVAASGAVGCVSSYGANDMVGNLWEWVDDWTDRAASCTDWTSQSGLPGDDMSCFGGDASTAAYQVPGALQRGGFFADGASAGPLAVNVLSDPSAAAGNVGFRCVR